MAVLLRDHFKIELQGHKNAFADLRKQLRAQSFIALWGKRLALGPSGTWSFSDEGTAWSGAEALLIALDPHLMVLRDGFALSDVSEEGQLDLFSLSSAHGRVHEKPKAHLAPTRRAS